MIKQEVEISPEIGFCLTNFSAEILEYRYSHAKIGDAQAGETVTLAKMVLEWGDLMATKVLGFKAVARQLAEGLHLRYVGEHPGALVDTYAAPYGVRLRIVDPAFEGRGLLERQAIVLPYLVELPKNVVDGIRVSLLITPVEREMSRLSLEFDEHSTPAR